MIIGDYTVIADVGRTIVQLLRDSMTPEPIQQPEYIGLASPADKGDLNLSLFLFKVKESSETRHTQMVERGSDMLQYPPMALDLYYLLTAHSNAEISQRTLDENRMLGRAVQVLYDHSIIRGAMLQGTLADHNEEVRIVMDELPLETLVTLFPDMPYKLTVCYSVGPINLDSTRMKATKRVLERDISIQG